MGICVCVGNSVFVLPGATGCGGDRHGRILGREEIDAKSQASTLPHLIDSGTAGTASVNDEAASRPTVNFAEYAGIT